MQLSQLGALGEFMGGVAVLVTLVYLAVQIRQSRKLAETSVHVALAANVATELQAIIPADMADILARSLDDPASLTSRERVALDCWWGLYVNNRQSEYREHGLGLYSAEAWDGFQHMLQEDLSPRFARNWWLETGRYRVQRSFREFVDSLIAETPPSDTHYTSRLDPGD